MESKDTTSQSANITNPFTTSALPQPSLGNAFQPTAWVGNQPALSNQENTLQKIPKPDATQNLVEQEKKPSVPTLSLANTNSPFKFPSEAAASTDTANPNIVVPPTPEISIQDQKSEKEPVSSLQSLSGGNPFAGATTFYSAIDNAKIEVPKQEKIEEEKQPANAFTLSSIPLATSEETLSEEAQKDNSAPLKAPEEEQKISAPSVADSPSTSVTQVEEAKQPIEESKKEVAQPAIEEDKLPLQPTNSKPEEKSPALLNPALNRSPAKREENPNQENIDNQEIKKEIKAQVGRLTNAKDILKTRAQTIQTDEIKGPCCEESKSKRREIMTSEKQRDTKKEQLQKLTTEIEELKKQRNEINDLYTKLPGDIETYTKEFTSLKAEHESVKKELDTITPTLPDKEAQRDELQTKVSKLEEEVAQISKLCDEGLKPQIEQSINHGKDLKNQIDTLSKEIEELEASKAEMKLKLDTNTKETQEMSNKVTEGNRQKELLKSDIDELQSKHETNLNDLESAKDQLKQLKDQYTQGVVKRHNKEQSLCARESKLHEREAELNRLAEELDVQRKYMLADFDARMERLEANDPFNVEAQRDAIAASAKAKAISDYTANPKNRSLADTNRLKSEVMRLEREKANEESELEMDSRKVAEMEGNLRELDDYLAVSQKRYDTNRAIAFLFGLGGFFALSTLVKVLF